MVAAWHQFSDLLDSEMTPANDQNNFLCKHGRDLGLTGCWTTVTLLIKVLRDKIIRPGGD
jgi:hypothetical protein